jgi:hypothetical protein
MLSYVKDRIINEEIFIDKMKPYTPIKGVGKVQIFNASTGELEVEAVSENVVTYAQSLIVFYNQFISYIGGKKNYENNFISDIDVDPFKNIYFAELLNEGIDPISEDPYSVRVPLTHNVRGYAERYAPYSGSDTSRGTINEAETSFYKDGTDFVAHFVFDFPTHAGNGDFNSIYWAQDDYSKAFTLDTINYDTGKVFDSVSTIIPMEDGNNNNILLAVCTTSETIDYIKFKYKLSSVYVFDKDMNFLFLRNMEPYITSIPLNNTIVFNMRSDGKIALIDTINYKIHLYDYELDSIVESIDVPGVVLSKCMLYEGNYLYTSDTSIDNSLKGLYKKFLITTGESPEIVWTDENYNADTWSFKIQDGKIMGRLDDYANQIWLDVSEDVKTATTHISISTDYYKTYQNVRNNKMNINSTSITGDEGQLILQVTRKIIGFMGAFTKLPSRLTKTEVNTMKLQYDFRFEDPMNKFINKTF